jgi:hypothetical protein
MKKLLMTGMSAAAAITFTSLATPVAQAVPYTPGQCYAGGNRAAQAQCAASLCMPYVQARQEAENTRCILTAINPPQIAAVSPTAPPPTGYLPGRIPYTPGAPGQPPLDPWGNGA